MRNFVLKGLDKEFVAHFQGQQFMGGLGKNGRDGHVGELGVGLDGIPKTGRDIDTHVNSACPYEQLMLVGPVQLVELPKSVPLPSLSTARLRQMHL